MADSLDPHAALSNSGYMVGRQLYDALVTFDEAGKEIKPMLAASWRRIDQLTMEFTLRDDVKFTDGEPFNAAAVVANVDRVLTANDPLIASGSRLRMGPLAGAEAVNSTTVRFKTKTPDPIFINRATTMFMMSPKFIKDGGNAKTQAAGTGSFKVGTFDGGRQLSLVANDTTWRGKSPIKTAKILAISEIGALLAALKTGEVDIAWNVQGDLVAGLKNDFNVGAQESYSCILSSFTPGVMPATDDKRVRTALNLAVNKEEIIKSIQGGYGTVPDGQIIKQGVAGYNDALKAFPYDPEKAKSLLKDAGFSNIEAQIATVAANKGTAEAISGYAKAVGITMPVRLLEFAVFSANGQTKTDFPMIIGNNDYFDLRDFDGPGGRYAGLVRPQQPYFKNDEFNKLYTASRAELDVTKRNDMIKRMLQIMYDEAAVLWVYQRQAPVVYSKKIAKLALPYDTSIYLWGVEKAA